MRHEPCQMLEIVFPFFRKSSPDKVVMCLKNKFLFCTRITQYYTRHGVFQHFHIINTKSKCSSLNNSHVTLHNGFKCFVKLQGCTGFLQWMHHSPFLHSLQPLLCPLLSSLLTEWWSFFSFSYCYRRFYSNLRSSSSASLHIVEHWPQGGRHDQDFSYVSNCFKFPPIWNSPFFIYILFMPNKIIKSLTFIWYSAFNLSLWAIKCYLCSQL